MKVRAGAASVFGAAQAEGSNGRESPFGSSIRSLDLAAGPAWPDERPRMRAGTRLPENG
jgi:hypothetical protein